MKFRAQAPPSRVFPRGIPIVGQRPEEPPPGRHFYEVPVLVMWEGEPLTAESVEVALPQPMGGQQFKQLGLQVAAQLQARRSAEKAPGVVLLTPIFLGFVPQEELDRIEAEAAKKAAAENGNGLVALEG